MVVPYTDNFFAALNSAVFTDGSFCYIPKGVRCPMELSTYFRINAANTGQFERTLIVADEGAHVSYLEGCTAPMRDENQLARGGRRTHRARRRANQILDRAELVSGRRERQGRHLQFRDQARPVQRQELEDFLDAGGDRLGHHLEISELHFAGRQFRRRILFRRRGEQLPAGRHRHEDDAHRQKHAQHDCVEGHFRRAAARTATAAW